MELSDLKNDGKILEDLNESAPIDDLEDFKDQGDLIYRPDDNFESDYDPDLFSMDDSELNEDNGKGLENINEKEDYDPQELDTENKDIATPENSEEISQNNEIEEIGKDGGRYQDLKDDGWGWNTNPPTEVHHMPADSSSHLERCDGPAIVMDYDDHRQTASCGNSREAQEYRAKQQELIEQGKFREAFQMDVDDLHDKFGDKYDEAISKAEEYLDQLEKENKI